MFSVELIKYSLKYFPQQSFFVKIPLSQVNNTTRPFVNEIIFPRKKRSSASNEFFVFRISNPGEKGGKKTASFVLNNSDDICGGQ